MKLLKNNKIYMKLIHQPTMLYIREVCTHVHIGRNTEEIRIREFLKEYYIANLKVITCILMLKAWLYMIILKYILLPPKNVA